MMDMVFLVWWWWSGGLEEEEYLLVCLDGWREGEARAARGEWGGCCCLEGLSLEAALSQCDCVKG